MAHDVLIAGALFPDVPSVQFPDSQQQWHSFTDVSDTTAAASDVAQGKVFYDAQGTLTQGTASGGGGASNIVTGTFKGTKANTNIDIDIPYTGSGYPIALTIYLTEGSSGDFFTFTQRGVVFYANYLKAYPDVLPSYSSASTNDDARECFLYKATSSDRLSAYSNNGNVFALYRDASASASNLELVRIRSATKLSVHMAAPNSSTASAVYGFKEGYEYTYVIQYSS